MKIELKNVKIHEDMSDETTCFSAAIYVDGKRAGEAENSGRGGNTNYHIYDRDTLAKAEKWAASLPPTIIKMDGDNDLIVESTLENYIEDLIERHQITKDVKKAVGKRGHGYRAKGQKYNIGCFIGFPQKYNADQIKKYLDKTYGADGWHYVTVKELEDEMLGSRS